MNSDHLGLIKHPRLSDTKKKQTATSTSIVALALSTESNGLQGAVVEE